MASTTRRRIAALPTTKFKVTKTSGFGHGPTPMPGTYDVVENFAYFIDTHRDQPHVPTFEDDIHRGMSRPTLVHYVPPDPSVIATAPTAPPHLGKLIRAEDGRMIDVDPKHKFVEVDWWTDFVTDYILEHGVAPVSNSGDTKGQLPTSHLRDARASVYKLKSLRQIVRAHEKASATAVGTPFKPTHGLKSPPPTPATKTSYKAAVAAFKKAPSAKTLTAVFPPVKSKAMTLITDHVFLSVTGGAKCDVGYFGATTRICGEPRSSHGK